MIILLALCAVGFRRPEAWELPALTKVTVGADPIWFLVRGEWRRLALSSVTIAAVAAISALTAPDLWSDWLRFLVLHARDASRPLGSSVVPPALLRVPVGLALLVWGARTNRTWVIPVAMLLCTPVLWLGSLTLSDACGARPRRPDPPVGPARSPGCLLGSPRSVDVGEVLDARRPTNHGPIRARQCANRSSDSMPWVIRTKRQPSVPTRMGLMTYETLREADPTTHSLHLVQAGPLSIQARSDAEGNRGRSRC